MIGTTLYRKTVLLSAAVVLVFIFLGWLTTNILTHAEREGFATRLSPMAVFARMIDDEGPEHRIEALKKLSRWTHDGFPGQFTLVDANGRAIFPPGSSVPLDFEKVQKPSEPYHPLPLFGGPPRLHFGGPPLPPVEIIRLSGEPPQYLIVQTDFHGPPPPMNNAAVAFGSLLLSVLLGVGVALFFLFRTLHENAKMADSVIAQLQSGNLKARFPISKMDEFGKAMSRFNQMAEEIERLVERLRSAEQSRMALLQELAHDLRTPVASLRSLLETLQAKAGAIPTEVQEEILRLSLRETEYFERLVEDLLVLAQVSEPRYQTERGPVMIGELLDDEADNVTAQFESKNKKVRLIADIPPFDYKVAGDAHLLRRMLRNALDNAFSFARSEVLVAAKILSTGMLEIMIRDDGPGFPEQVMQSYGERRVSRILGGTRDGRLSVGLGSVIIATVARVHRGEVTARNRVVSEKVTGAELIIRIPLSKS